MRGKLFAVVWLAALALVPAALAGEGGLGPVDPRSPGAERIADIYWFIAAFALFILLLVTVPLVLFIVRYRAGGRAREVEGPQVRGNTRLELAWTALPVLMLVAIASFVFYKLPGINDPAAAADEERQSVRVEGRQFYWQFEYPNEVIAVDRLRLPAGRTTELEITAPTEDVIHSFWVPALAGKRDAVPRQIETMRVRPDETGRFQVVCGEFCGIQHAQMYGSVEVLEPDQFDRWLAEEKRAQEQGTSELGRATYEAACAKCHGFQAEGLIGPPLVGNALLREREGLETIVRNGQGAMPAVGEGWDERQMDALFRFVQRRFAPEGEDNGS